MQSFVYHGRTFPNHDTMLKIYPGADGMKTGYTDASGHNLVTSAVRDGVRLIGVVMGAGSNPERDRDMTAALNGGYAELDGGGRTTRVAGRFDLVSAAHAATVAHPRPAAREPHVRRVAERVRASSDSGWIVQVGSFSNPHSAHVAAERARRHTRRGDPHVERIRLHRRTWYRAQVTGFTEASAQQACAVIARHQKARCLILRPEHPVVASR